MQIAIKLTLRRRDIVLLVFAIIWKLSAVISYLKHWRKIKPKDISSFLQLNKITYFFHSSYLPTQQKVFLTKFSNFYYKGFVFMWTLQRHIKVYHRSIWLLYQKKKINLYKQFSGIICSNNFTRNNITTPLIFLFELASPIFHL